MQAKSKCFAQRPGEKPPHWTNAHWTNAHWTNAQVKVVCLSPAPAEPCTTWAFTDCLQRIVLDRSFRNMSIWGTENWMTLLITPMKYEKSYQLNKLSTLHYNSCLPRPFWPPRWSCWQKIPQFWQNIFKEVSAVHSKHWQWDFQRQVCSEK